MQISDSERQSEKNKNTDADRNYNYNLEMLPAFLIIKYLAICKDS